MPTSSGSRSQVLYKAQTGFGTAATGNFTRARLSAHNFEVVKEVIENDELRQDRQMLVDEHGAKSATGTIDVNLIPVDHDWLILAALMTTAFGGVPLTAPIG